MTEEADLPDEGEQVDTFGVTDNKGVSLEECRRRPGDAEAKLRLRVTSSLGRRGLRATSTSTPLDAASPRGSSCWLRWTHGASMSNCTVTCETTVSPRFENEVIDLPDA